MQLIAVMLSSFLFGVALGWLMVANNPQYHDHAHHALTQPASWPNLRVWLSIPWEMAQAWWWARPWARRG